jgi:ABC-type nickel/cobalt efflux system permease component RcnA
MFDGMIITALAVGFFLGLRHALDPDHIVAVSTIVSECKSLRRSSLVGTFWGLGHTFSLLLVGLAVIALKVNLTERVAVWMEFAVAVMLVGLGIKAVVTALRGWRLHLHKHEHGGRPHVHLHLHKPGEAETHQHRHLIGLGTKPFLVGMVHGLAGSAALMILVVATIPSAVAGLIYVAVFGVGSVGGMLLMSSIISLPFLLTARRLSVLGNVLQVSVGVFSVGFGIYLMSQSAQLFGPQ